MPNLDSDVEDDQNDETLVLWDRTLLDDELRQGVNIVLLSDSCHSGTIYWRRGGLEEAENAFVKRLFYENLSVNSSDSVAVPRPAVGTSAPAARNAFFEPNASPTPVLTRELPFEVNHGCADNQLSQEVNGAGVFTTVLDRTWANNSFQGSYTAFYRAILSRMLPKPNPAARPVGSKSAGTRGENPVQPIVPGLEQSRSYSMHYDVRHGRASSRLSTPRHLTMSGPPKWKKPQSARKPRLTLPDGRWANVRRWRSPAHHLGSTYAADGGAPGMKGRSVPRCRRSWPTLNDRHVRHRRLWRGDTQCAACGLQSATGERFHGCTAAQATVRRLQRADADPSDLRQVIDGDRIGECASIHSSTRWTCRVAISSARRQCGRFWPRQPRKSPSGVRSSLAAVGRRKQPLVLPVEFAGHPMAEGTQAGSRTRLDGELARPFLERRQPAKSASRCLVHERSVEREHQRSEGLRLQLKLLTGACKLAQAGVEIVS